MAEIFNNYLTSKTYAKGDAIVIVPKAGSNIASGNGVGSRKSYTKSQLHSIYISQETNGNYTSNPLNEKVFITLYVKDGNNEYYIANNVLVLPHSSFYIEKTITLLAQQELYLRYTTTNTKANCKLFTVCSSIDIEE